MATKPSITHIRRGATALTSEAGKLIRDRALNAAHQALVMALQTVQAADRKLRGAATPRRKATRTTRASGKRKATRAVSKARQAVATTTRRAKTARRGRRVAR
jgi:hypothetical protein